ncbi:ATP-dependent RNA helicase [Dichotomopilus funicola]|uniref:ATP-dependent RNA helicase n=1 Tax=Dichotomopilus funicola TaxID=1934379 RepID=A0AAN6V756_9PEZI|nr:ATP-dependent RNA helicase [Dichotomopilus funicola]
MDILKVLSRGIKPNPKKGKPQQQQHQSQIHGQGTTTTTTTTTAQFLLPSAGAIPHPQLFHDHVAAATRGKKRKRRRGGGGDGDVVSEAEDEEDSEVDYFAAPKKPALERSAAAGIDAEADETLRKRKVKLLDEEECKRILRAHRLKFTILSDVVVGDAPGENNEGSGPMRTSKKKKKGGDKDKDKESKTKATEAKKEKKKDEHKRQLFPQPLNSFGELRHIYDVAPQLASNIAAQGFRLPTEVQMASLPLLLRPALALKNSVEDTGVGESGADFLAVAPTGSGKTITFLIPAIDGVLKRRAEEGASSSREGQEQDEHVLQAVVVAPTRELASQIVNEGRKLAIGTGVRVVLMKRTLRLKAEEVEGEGKDEKDEESGSDEDEEDEDEDEGEEVEDDDDENEDEDGNEKNTKEKPKKEKPFARADILVTTPKILLNALTGKSGRKTLPTVRSLILDEADVLLDPIFRRQTTAIWRACTHPNVSLTCWSATMASNVEALITKQLAKRARYVQKTTTTTSPRPRPPLIRLVVGLKDTAVPNITHKLTYTATEPGKLLALRQLLHPASSSDSGPPLRPPFLVFTQTIDRAQALHDELKYDIPLEAGGSARVAVLHSSLADAARSRIMARFRAGEVWVLITTDVLARGVDFAGVNGVVNYDVPTSAAAYVHRAGRTGRAGRQGGVAVTFYTKDDIPFVKSIANVIAASEKQAAAAAKGSSSSPDKTPTPTIQKWLLDALPDVAKEDRRKLKVRGVEARRAGGKAAPITTKSAWERRREHNKAQAIEASRRRKRLNRGEQKRLGGKDKGSVGDEKAGDEEGEWGGLDD